jgi:hypothetical protein
MKIAAALALLALIAPGCGGGARSSGPIAATPTPTASSSPQPMFEAIPEYGGGPGRELAFNLVYPGPNGGKGSPVPAQEAGPHRWERHYAAGKKACGRGSHARLAGKLGLPSDADSITIAEAYGERFPIPDRVAAATGCREGIVYGS